jgi:hypothetical protein
MIESATFTIVLCLWWIDLMSHTAERSLSWMYSLAFPFAAAFFSACR